MPVEAQIRETKEHSLYVECRLLGRGTITDPFRPAVFDDGSRAYAHLDADADIDYKKKKVRLYVNKLRTPPAAITAIRSKYTILKETGTGETWQPHIGV